MRPACPARCSGAKWLCRNTIANEAQRPVPRALARGLPVRFDRPSVGFLSREQIESNVEAIKGQLAHLLDFETKINPARVINNADWLMPLSLVDFLRDIGKHFTVNAMMASTEVAAWLIEQPCPS